jgi:hypothetical protein
LGVTVPVVLPFLGARLESGTALDAAAPVIVKRLSNMRKVRPRVRGMGRVSAMVAPPPQGHGA